MKTRPKFYTRKLKSIRGFDIWLVDGEYIRKNISENFVNYDQHYHLNFIPKNEFWIEKETVHKERKYFIRHLLVENELMEKGIHYHKAFWRASVVQKKARLRSKEVHEIKKLGKKEVIKRIHYELMKKFSSGKIKVWIINGKLVRDMYFIDFAYGGHDEVYDFVPRNEIWIEKDLAKESEKFILIHELHERYHMIKNKLSYTKAHKRATRVETYARNHPEKSQEILKREIKRNNELSC